MRYVPYDTLELSSPRLPRSFSLVKKYEVEFNKAALSLAEGMTNPQQKKAALNRLLKVGRWRAAMTRMGSTLSGCTLEVHTGDSDPDCTPGTRGSTRDAFMTGRTATGPALGHLLAGHRHAQPHAPLAPPLALHTVRKRPTHAVFVSSGLHPAWSPTASRSSAPGPCSTASHDTHGCIRTHACHDQGAAPQLFRPLPPSELIMGWAGYTYCTPHHRRRRSVTFVCRPTT